MTVLRAVFLQNWGFDYSARGCDQVEELRTSIRVDGIDARMRCAYDS